MGKIIVYCQTLDPALLAPALGGHEVIPTAGRSELVEAVIGENDLRGVLFQKEELSAEDRHFLASLKKSFPILALAIVSGETPARLPAGAAAIDSGLGSGALAEAVSGFAASISSANRREHQRFDWPLQGALSTDQRSWQSFPIRSLSAGGAFLVCPADCPVPGTEAGLRILFQDFQIRTRCRVLDPRQASSNLPAGFGVRFTELSTRAQELLDRIIHDALVEVLLAPEREPGLPSLDGEELVPGDFELF
jgi:hypothetical protein